MAPTKLTPETQRALIQAIEKGLRAKVDICSYAGISPTTLKVWEGQAQAGDTAAQELFAALDGARARVKAQLVAKMQRAGRGDWRMWREMLALVDPQEYGKAPAQSVELSGKVQTEDVTLDDEERAARVAELLERARVRRAGSAADHAAAGDVVAGDGAA